MFVEGKLLFVDVHFLVARDILDCSVLLVGSSK